MGQFRDCLQILLLIYANSSKPWVFRRLLGKYKLINSLKFVILEEKIENDTLTISQIWFPSAKFHQNTTKHSGIWDKDISQSLTMYRDELILCR